jgi:hypothetical protein
MRFWGLPSTRHCSTGAQKIACKAGRQLRTPAAAAAQAR